MDNQREPASPKDSTDNDHRKNDGNMSPVIKVRTPTKVRELRLLQPSVSVRNLADEFSSRPGKNFQMFGVNIMSSPPSRSGEVKQRRLEESLKNAASNSIMGQYRRGRKQSNVARSEKVVEKAQKIQRRSAETKPGPAKTNNAKNLRRSSEWESTRTGIESRAQFEGTGGKNIHSDVDTTGCENDYPR